MEELKQSDLSCCRNLQTSSRNPTSSAVRERSSPLAARLPSDRLGGHRLFLFTGNVIIIMKFHCCNFAFITGQSPPASALSSTDELIVGSWPAQMA
jgi:hypothetical protein